MTTVKNIPYTKYAIKNTRYNTCCREISWKAGISKVIKSKNFKRYTYEAKEKNSDMNTVTMVNVTI